MHQHSARMRLLCQSALLAALYAALTMALPVLSFGMMQLRFSEALAVLPILYPPATVGLTVGCALSNLLGFFSGANPIGLVDTLVGSAATLLAGLCGAGVGRLIGPEHPHRRLLLGLVFPVVFNGLVVGAELTALYLDAFRLNVLWVAAGELAVCYLFGYPLGLWMQRSGAAQKIFHTDELG